MVDIYKSIVELKKDEGPCVLVTVTKKDGKGPAVVGGKMLVFKDGSIKGTVGGGALELLAIKEAEKCMINRESYSLNYDLSQEEIYIDGIKTGMVCGGMVQLFYEYIDLGIPVYIFGAGHVGQAIVRHLENLNYYTNVLDNREDVLEFVRNANHKILLDYNNLFINFEIKENSYVIIATHSHDFDYRVLKNIYLKGFKPSYIGMLGSNKKVDLFMERLNNDLPNEKDFSNLYTPAGLDIGGGSPGEIAISIIAEMQALNYKKEGNKHARC